MSLILDALKKSEAERQLGRAPGLMSPTIRVSRRRGISPWWGVFGLAIAIAVAAPLWMLANSKEEFDARVAREATDAARPDAAAPTANPPVTVPDAAPAESRVVDEPVPDDRAAVMPNDPDFASVERESLPMSPPVPPAPNPAPPIASTVPPLPEPPVLVETPPLPTIDATPAIEPAPIDEPPLEALPTINELFPEIRTALPTLKLTMHVYAAEPASRFVLIDGKRLREGARIAGKLSVSEIRRDGAVLDFDGKRFLLPRP